LIPPPANRRELGSYRLGERCIQVVYNHEHPDGPSGQCLTWVPKRGIVETRIREASQFTGVAVADFGWNTPFSDWAEASTIAFARSIPI